MTRKQFPITKLFLYAIFTAFIVFHVTQSAFAEGNDSYSKGTDWQNPAKAAITALLAIPINTPTPKAEFTFVFEKIGMNVPLSPLTINNDTAKENMPDIKPVTISFNEDDGYIFEEGGIWFLLKESENFIEGMIGDVWGNGTGIYSYKVSEAQSGITLSETGIDGNAYSIAKYDVEIWVDKEYPDGKLYPKFVVVKIKEKNTDNIYPHFAEGTKVDPTPGKKDKINKTEFINTNYSQMLFNNTYWKTDGSHIENTTESVLEIVNKMGGLGAVLETPFEFTVAVTHPRIMSENPVCRAIVLDAGGKNITDDKHTNYNNGYLKIPSGEELKINLSDGQRLVFVDSYIGSIVSVKEKVSSDYIISYEYSFNDSEKFFYSVGLDFGFPRLGFDNGPHYLNAGIDINKVTFTNTRIGATPTGVSVDDLPYAVLIVIALTCVAFFVAIKLNKKKEAHKA